MEKENDAIAMKSKNLVLQNLCKFIRLIFWFYSNKYTKSNENYEFLFYGGLFLFIMKDVFGIYLVSDQVFKSLTFPN